MKQTSVIAECFIDTDSDAPGSATFADIAEDVVDERQKDEDAAAKSAQRTSRGNTRSLRSRAQAKGPTGRSSFLFELPAVFPSILYGERAEERERHVWCVCLSFHRFNKERLGNAERLALSAVRLDPLASIAFLICLVSISFVRVTFGIFVFYFENCVGFRCV